MSRVFAEQSLLEAQPPVKSKACRIGFQSGSVCLPAERLMIAQTLFSTAVSVGGRSHVTDITDRGVAVDYIYYPGLHSTSHFTSV